eukprot:8954432-Alexandrium_andersonii.AAC.1
MPRRVLVFEFSASSMFRASLVLWWALVQRDAPRMGGGGEDFGRAARPAPSSSEFRAKPQPSSPSADGSLAGWCSS